ncbi:SGNH/GDSL hydrolase family protein [Actinocrispum wychmicini]|uniref:Lysophospholipase L1-like esterase n=1 Tax=Actinocrispum wychmicini TaxID=1213861 RepID=A0A4R2K749_9PSEU|nr:SGNH/GDSL hydrolase family protein [Actinocrispum wychmicini]TCO65769.1 lysophospholipase L1-like esterase [Actinocrispum wychmicini]
MRIVVALVALLGLITLATPATAAGSRGGYVALGDSYASGPGIPDQTGTPAGCARSNHNYPALLASWLRVKLTDVSCGGAKTTDMTAPQKVTGGVNPPQLTALTKDTQVVTLMIGGNDIGFGEILQTCGRLGASDPTGNPCEKHYQATGKDELAGRVAATAPKIAAVLDGIRKRSPHAHVVVVGYLRILPQTGSCFPAVPFATGDGPYFDSVERLLNTMLADQARRHGAAFVNPYAFSAGHDACQAPDRKWVEGLVPTSPSAPMHPNARGMQTVALVAFPSVLFGLLG